MWVLRNTSTKFSWKGTFMQALAQRADQQHSCSTGTKGSVRGLLKLIFHSFEQGGFHLLGVVHQNCHSCCSGLGSTIPNGKTDPAELLRVNSNCWSSSSSFQGHCSEGTRKMQDVFKAVVRWKKGFGFINEDLDNFRNNRKRKICLKTGFLCGRVWRQCTFQEKRFLHKPLGDNGQTAALLARLCFF